MEMSCCVTSRWREKVTQPPRCVDSSAASAAFAPLRLCENRRLNEEAHLSQRRKGAAIHFSKTINPRLKTAAKFERVSRKT